MTTPTSTTTEAATTDAFSICEDLPEDALDPARCLNDQAVWLLSSARPGCGINALLSDNYEQFWQSDGLVPHTINIQFYKRQSVAEVALRLSLKQDESYTPEKITIRAGNLLTDLEPVRGIKVGEVEGWLRIPLGNPERLGLQRYLRTHFLQISVSQMHQQGRDTHIRGIKVLGPPVTASAPSAMRVGLPQWEDDSFLSPGVLR